MDFKPLGISSSSFYYTWGGYGTCFDISLDYTLSSKLDRGALSAAVRKTLSAFPEFKYRPVIHDGMVGYIPNTDEVPLIEDVPSLADMGRDSICYGTDDTAGYPFMFLCRDDGFRFSYYHGLSDAKGVTCFIHTLFYNYARMLSFDVPATENVRLDESSALSMDELERMDPYKKYAKEIVLKPDKPSAPGSFAIPETVTEPEDENMYYLKFTFPLGDFLKKVKSYQTSAASMMVVCLSRAIHGLYDTKGLPITTMLSADMRPYYGTGTVSNFSDAILLPYDEGFNELKAEEQLICMKQLMKDQMNRQHFDRAIVNKVADIESKRSSGVPITEWNRRFSAVASAQADTAPITCAFTYSGRQDLPDAYAFLVTDVDKEPHVRGIGTKKNLICTTYGDTFRVVISQYGRSDEFIQALRRELSAFNIEAGDVCRYTHNGFQMVNEKLMSV
ncbi:hypothetical protein BXO88_14740 [Oribacterium sp. C9]|uniref:hypothetical protein n=1 Tax=Oribacterium sp. C9 TaxID=1943579 RepID=UPI00098E9CF4|nr:hypothetical protein [Oribacterium sp. C9]OON84979.1 hypothetical protein BXO88_14740 [Oribacterium sp. C9]